MDLTNPGDSTVTTGHKVHVHIDPVVASTGCKEGLGHFNPYLGSPEGACSPQNPLACEVGDLSEKHAAYDINGGRKFYNDEDLPLGGEQTVLGRSIIFHGSGGSGSRLVCGNILPTNGNTFTLAFSSDVSYDRLSLTATISSALSIHASRVTVLHNVAVPTNNTAGTCQYVMVHISGSLDAASTAAVLAGTGMSPYTPTEKCISETGAQVVGVATRSGASTLLQRSGLLLMVLTALFCWLSTNVMIF